MNTKQIETEALLLSAKDRARLALELIESLDEIPRAEIEALWLSEAQCRAQQLDASEAELIPSEVVVREARALLKQ